MRNVNKLPGTWRLDRITSEGEVRPSLNDHNNSELMIFRADGTFDRHLKINGQLQPPIQNEKWVGNSHDVFVLHKNKVFYMVDLVTHDTLVLKEQGTDQKRVYKKVQ